MALLKSAFYFTLRKAASKRFLQAALRVHIERLNQELSRSASNRVISGPFEGMVIPSATSWGDDGDRGPKLLGTYEADAHRTLLEMVFAAYTDVVNIGCAEGYYAVGLARLLPTAIVHAFDISISASKVCRQAAEENNVSPRVSIYGTCTTENLEKILNASARALVVSGCEGAELALLDPTQAPALLHADLLIETHDRSQPGCSSTLEERFKSSHRVERIEQGPRNPHAFHELADWREVDKWLLVNENRSEGRTSLLCLANTHLNDRV